MKTTRTFNGYWFLLAIVVAVVVGESVTWKLADVYGFRIGRVAVDIFCVGLVLVVTSLLYEDADIG